MTQQTAFKPNIKWYQNKQTVTFEIDHRDVQNESIQIEPNQVSIKFVQNDKNYEDVLELFSEVNDSTSKVTKSGYSINVNLEKKDQGFWKYLTKNDQQKKNIKVDWNNFNDSEEEEQEEKTQGGMGGMGGMDLQQMMASMNPGMGGQQDEDSDSDEEQGHEHKDDCCDQNEPKLEDLEKIEE